jgi:uncharacterized membrane protein YphA (DoxX/SURF4 family)
MKPDSKTLYWTLTLLFVVPLGLSGVTYLMQIAVNVQGLDHLGYPHYIMPFLGIAKILGVIAIVWGRFEKLKEWAYAGFAFDLLLAAYSHVESGDGARASFPVIMLLIMFGSYMQWKIRQNRFANA